MMSTTTASTASAASGDSVPDPNTALRMDRVTKTFTISEQKTITAVNNLSLSIGRGEVVAFLGPNGAGKSTSIDLLLGLTKPDSGSVSVFGLDPITAAHAGLISAVMQSGGMLPDLTMGDTMNMIGSLYRGADVEECMRRANITQLADRTVGKSSGGEVQRLRYALALLPDPEIMILDEPTAGMDINARHDFWKQVRQDTSRGRTVVFATHYLEEADNFADRVIMIKDGQIVADGSVDEIRTATAGRVLSCVLPDDAVNALLSDPKAKLIDRRGHRTYFDHPDSDAFATALLTAGAKELEIAPRSLEEAFLTLTSK
ncbi:ABC transporter ATP-binding protein [Devriesea agamarum]|uniref:ABC transporter ATP-binding protein n=1 Tax=Devriesea agamarum TaxID=472569 RepID=UPI00071E0374|nr:ABC transporter ATP-binding protein [Devriesea agamarum]